MLDSPPGYFDEHPAELQSTRNRGVDSADSEDNEKKLTKCSFGVKGRNMEEREERMEVREEE